MAIARHALALRPLMTAALGLTLLSFTLPATAASFDCNKAGTATERAICATPALSKLDERLNSEYQRAMTNLPAADARVLRSQQLAWLKTRNACATGAADAASCLQTSMQQRTEALLHTADRAIATLDDTIRAIPADPHAAALKLREYRAGLPSAWLVYLHQFEPASKVTDAEAQQRADQARNALADPFMKSLLADIENDTTTTPEQAALYLLRMSIETAGYREGAVNGKEREYAHCFIFQRQGQAAYDTFGALYGSTRDIWAPICQPQGDLFEQPAWIAMNHAIMPAIETASAATGTMRNASFADWRMFDLRATASPNDFLTSDQTRGSDAAPEKTLRAWSDTGWSKEDRDAVLQAAATAQQTTAAWLQKERNFTQQDATAAASNIVRGWLKQRLQFIGGDYS